MTAGRTSSRNRASSPHWDCAAIVGVGLIGGSLGLALKQARVVRKVIGIGPRQDSLRTAKNRGAIDQATTKLADGVAEAAIVVICAPVGLIAKLAIEAARHCPAQCVITDAGSTKAAIVNAVSAAQAAGQFPEHVSFVGGHPIAGGEQSGPEAAAADLFQSRRVILTPSEGTSKAAVRTVKQLWEATGAKVSSTTPEAHDRLLAASSHLPHVVAAALSASLDSRERQHSAGGLADTTRIAAGDPQVWRDILQTNKAEVTAAIHRFQSTLTELSEAIAQDDQHKLTSILRKAKRNRDAL